MTLPKAAQNHYRAMQSLQLLTVGAGRRAWRNIEPGRISESWSYALSSAMPVFAGAQTRAALAGSTYAAATLAEQGDYVAPTALVAVESFAGFASDGRQLASLLYRPVVAAKARIGAGMPTESAMDVGLRLLDQILRTQIADTARQAGGIDIAMRAGVGYVRMLNEPSCPDCTVQGGKWFRWNAGFLRHPNCDCVHCASTAGSLQAARDEGLITDPYEAFSRLSRADQDRRYGAGNAQAIRDGADIGQVVNSRRGMTPNGNFTTEGTSKRGNAAKGLAPGQRRMTPELIYRQSKTRQEALDMLALHGFVLPGGQIPTGALLGQREGFGALGRGGTRKGASQDVVNARETGIRDPRNRNVMTEAERRLYDAQQAYELALSGVSPYSSPGFGNTPDPMGARLNRVGAGTRPVTQAELATAELNYRRMLATGGQKFTR